MVHYSDLEGKRVLVTGANRGIGHAIAVSLAKQQAHLVINYRPGKEEMAHKLKNEFEQIGGRCDTICFDLSNGEQIKESITSYIKEHGALSGLVNNAGISKDQIVLRLKESDIAETLNINLLGTMLVTSALTRSLLKEEHVSIVHISSIVGLMGNPSQISYAASKAGMIGFSKSYAKELGSRNIRSNVICPGFIRTDMTDKLEDGVQQSYMSDIPLKRFGEGEEIAELVNFLLSRASSYITGEVIKIDGGLYI
ncbi:MAG: 3-oxoacyl-ACP reductase FabG [Bdellovibrionales bacterium]|nr:3-oxoacyl-ACP reductase FabG [Bdellovibrionales bacterium]MBT3526459.1 3-oxoacyl-ACP reductase FabG [Bdellovibrionales bacterium]MBT7670023.1 3-oxoacyl-ACP reductase FabG [Bdellovibrionales bacterium]MBT7766630.1 3-oxoacyl-ACP reductase FabG [Bdellovibrionales bacterium]